MKENRRRLRIPLALLAAVLFLALTFEPTPSDPAPSDTNTPPPPADTQEMTRFLVAGTGAAADGQFHAFKPGDLAAAVEPAPEPRKLSLLDSGPDVEARRRFLHRMPYGTAIALAAERHHVDGLLLAAIVDAESDFSAQAVSPQGALGLMQIIPEVAEDFGVKGDLLDPYVNVDVGSRYVGSLIKDYKGDLERVLAAYNAGPGVVDRYKGVPPYTETRSFVRGVLARYEEYTRKAAAAGSVKAAVVGARATSAL
jgi:soluble lytic murein transglycosylase-like protein